MTNSTTDPNPLVTRLGDLGSEYFAWQVPVDLVPRLAGGLDNVRMGFRKAFFDAEQGIVVLMAPSFHHETMMGSIDKAMVKLCDAAGVDYLPCGSVRMRLPTDPPKTGIEPDCAFYIGANAAAYQALDDGGENAAENMDQFVVDTPPDLVVEVETTHVDDAKMKRYLTLGVPEVWKTQGDPVHHDISVTMWAMEEDGYAQVTTSPALGLAPDAVSDILNIRSGQKAEYEQAVLEAADTVRTHAASLRQENDAGLTP